MRMSHNLVNFERKRTAITGAVPNAFPSGHPRWKSTALSRIFDGLPLRPLRLTLEWQPLTLCRRC
jgi:hypothetical protein